MRPFKRWNARTPQFCKWWSGNENEQKNTIRTFVRERQLLIVYLLCARTIPVHGLKYGRPVKGILLWFCYVGLASHFDGHTIAGAYHRVFGIYVNHQQFLFIPNSNGIKSNRHLSRCEYYILPALQLFDFIILPQTCTTYIVAHQSQYMYAGRPRKEFHLYFSPPPPLSLSLISLSVAPAQLKNGDEEEQKTAINSVCYLLISSCWLRSHHANRLKGKEEMKKREKRKKLNETNDRTSEIRKWV